MILLDPPEQSAENCSSYRKMHPKGPKTEKNQSRLKITISLENFQSRLKFSILTFRIPHKNRGLVGGSLEIFNLD